jgi:hypothetical protein
MTPKRLEAMERSWVMRTLRQGVKPRTSTNWSREGGREGGHLEHKLDRASAEHAVEVQSHNPSSVREAEKLDEIELVHAPLNDLLKQEAENGADQVQQEERDDCK